MREPRAPARGGAGRLTMPGNQRPLEARLAARVAPTVGRGLLLVLALTGVGLGLHAVSGTALLERTGEAGVLVAPQVHVTVMCATLLVYGLMAVRWLTADRVPFVDGGQRGTLAGVVGVAVGALLIVLTNRQIAVQEPWRTLWGPGELYVDALALMLMWGITRGIYFSATRADRAAIAKVPVDLWNTIPLREFCTDGVRLALAWSVGISLTVVFLFIDPNPTLQVDSIKVLGPFIAAGIAIAGLCLVRPMWALRSRIRREKAGAVAVIDRQLSALHEAEATGAVKEHGREADLLARRQFILAVPEWVIGGRTSQILGLYILIPAGTWLVGPVLRQLLNDVLIVRLARDLLKFLGP